MITPDEISRLREYLRNNSNDTGVILTHVNPIFSLLDEIERLQAQLRAATLVVGNDPDTFDWNTLTRIEEQEREIERLRDELKETGATLAISRKGVRDLSDDLAAALKRAEAAERELYVLRLNHAHGEHDDRCPRCEAERRWKEVDKPEIIQPQEMLSVGTRVSINGHIAKVDDNAVMTPYTVVLSSGVIIHPHRQDITVRNE